MTRFQPINLLAKTILVTLSIFCFSPSNIAYAAVCTIHGSSGIGGTGTPIHNSPIGGTGMIALISGIGGTGKPIQKNGNGSGIGGTGQQAGIVVGTITGFGSICVNGIEIHYSSSTPLQSDGQIVNQDKLAIGQVVAVGVSGFGNEVTAKEMHIIHAVTGPISSIDFVKGQMIVLGQMVKLPIDTSSLTRSSTIQIGSFVAVSGLRDLSGTIIASRVNKITTKPTASLRGTISHSSKNSFTVQGVKIASPLPTGITKGQNITVSGPIMGHSIKPERVMVSEEENLSTEVGGLISIEGYLAHNQNGLSVKFSGRTIDIPTELESEVKQLNEHQKIVITGRLEQDNHIQLEQIILPPQQREGQERETHQDEQGKSSQNDHDKRNSIPEQHPDALDKENDQFEHGQPEKVETPEYENPETPEYQKPEIPEYQKPEIPEYQKPEIPTYQRPEIPTYQRPEIPTYQRPETPEF